MCECCNVGSVDGCDLAASTLCMYDLSDLIVLLWARVR